MIAGSEAPQTVTEVPLGACRPPARDVGPCISSDLETFINRAVSTGGKWGLSRIPFRS